MKNKKKLLSLLIDSIIGIAHLFFVVLLVLVVLGLVFGNPYNLRDKQHMNYNTLYRLYENLKKENDELSMKYKEQWVLNNVLIDNAESNTSCDTLFSLYNTFEEVKDSQAFQIETKLFYNQDMLEAEYPNEFIRSITSLGWYLIIVAILYLLLGLRRWIRKLNETQENTSNTL